MRKSKIKIMRADNGNFNIVTDFGVIGLYDTHSCCEYWRLEYKDKAVCDDDVDTHLIDLFNDDDNEISYGNWLKFTSKLCDTDEYAEAVLNMSNNRRMYVHSADNGYYSCVVLHELIK